HTTAAYVGRQPEGERLPFLRMLVLHNADALRATVRFCATEGIGAFRINNALVPLATHPEVGVPTEALGDDVLLALEEAGREAAAAAVRLSFHPDPYVVLASDKPPVVPSAVAELDHLGRLGALVGAQQLTVHVGTTVGGKPAALERMARGLDRLELSARERLVVENDDR